MLKLTKLWEHPKNSILLISLVIGIVFLYFESIIVSIILAQLSWSDLSSGFADFIFPQQRFLTIYEEWGSSGIELETIHTYWDFLFIIGYVLALSSFFY